MTKKSENLTLWHASRADVERPTVAGRIAGEHHANSGLGLFCATAPHSYIAGFGDNIHEMTLKSEARIMKMGIIDLQKMGQSKESLEEPDRAWFENEGRRISQDHDVIILIETNGYASQAILLIDDCVETSRPHSKDAFLDRATSIMDDMKTFENGEPQRILSRGLEDQNDLARPLQRSSNER